MVQTRISPGSSSIQCIFMLVLIWKFDHIQAARFSDVTFGYARPNVSVLKPRTRAWIPPKVAT
jgi:hypothetical protein